MIYIYIGGAKYFYTVAHAQGASFSNKQVFLNLTIFFS